MTTFLLGLVVLARVHAALPDLAKWGDWRAAGMGTVLNPPRGNVDADVRRTERFLKDMVTELAGERLRREGIQLTISVMAHDRPNAFIARHSGRREVREFAAEDERLRARGERRVRKKKWAATALPIEVVEALGFNAEENVYQLGVSTGLLRLLRTRAQLAFVLGHELTHLFEGHLKAMVDARPRDRFKGWWDSQRHELIADDGGIVALTTKFSLDGAIEAINALSEAGDHRDDAILSLLSNHHHDGMRIASLQARAELLSRTKPGALIVRDEPLPSFVRVARPERSAAMRGFDEQRTVLLDLARGYPRSADDLGEFFANTEARDESSKYAPLWRARLKPAQYARVVVDVLDVLDAADLAVPMASRSDALLVVLRVITDLCPDQSYWNFIGADDSIRLRLFLAKTAAGAWRVDPLLTTLESHSDVKKSHAQAMMDIFTIRPSASKTLTRLAAHETAWREATRAIVSRKLNSESDYFLRRLISNDGYYRLQPDALALMRAVTLEELARGDVVDHLVKQFSSDWGEDRFLFANLLARFDADPDADPAAATFATELRARLWPQIERFKTFRDETLRDLVAQDDARPGRVFSLLESALGTSSLGALPEDLARIAGDRLVHHVANWERTHEGRSFGLSADLLELATRRWSSDAPPADRLRLWNFISAEFSRTASNFEAAPTELRREVGARIEAFVRSLSPEALIGISSAMSARGEGALRRYLKTHHDREGSLDRLADFAATLEGVMPKAFSEALEVRTALIQDASVRGSVLSWASVVPEVYEYLRRDFSADDLTRLFTVLRAYVGFARRLEIHFEPLSDLRQWSLPAPAVETALRLLIDRRHEYADAERWRRVLDDVYALNVHAVDRRAEFRPKLAAITEDRLRAVAGPELMRWARTPAVLRLLTPDRAAEVLIEALENSPAAHAKFDELGDIVRDFVDELKLEADYPDVYQIFRARWAERRRQQPNSSYLPRREVGLTERTENFSSHVRGLSAMIAKVREGDFDGQIETIEYLMGHRDDAPEYLTKLFVDTEFSARLGAALPVTGLLANARARLQRESVVVRTMVANSFLAGPRSVISTADGVDRLIARVIAKFRPEAREFAEVIARAVIRAQGNSASLAFASVLAQRRGDDEEPLSFEARMLNNLFSAFGVPGTKYAQYLAFSPHLAVYRTALEDMQDAALPLDYLEAVELVEAKYGAAWPTHYLVVGIEGSGAVNVAVTLRDLRTGEDLILNVLRDQIRTAARHHFHKFRRALDLVLEDARFTGRFGYLRALSRIIETSVELEFDKTRVARMFETVAPLYRGSRHGWTLTSPDVREVGAEAIVMTKAPGRSARRVLTHDPALYREAMREFAEVEFDVLRGTAGGGAMRSRDLVANPDVHDGQVYIDPATRTITVLDPGQTIPITNLERSQALDVLGFLTADADTAATATWLQREFSTAVPIAPAVLASLRDPENHIDSFMRLVGVVEDAGGHVPLSVLHWIIGAHRLVQLGVKVGVDYEARFGLMVKARRFGVPNEVANFAFASERAIVRCQRWLLAK